MHASSYTLDASTMASYGKGGRPIPSLFKDHSTEATFDMLGITQASVDFPMADFLAAVSQGNDSPEQEPDVKLRGLFGKIGKDRPDVEALDDETRREVMKILEGPISDGKQISRPIFERQWQGFQQYWYKCCGSDTLAKFLLTALPESLRSLYTQLHLFMGWSFGFTRIGEEERRDGEAIALHKTHIWAPGAKRELLLQSPDQEGPELARCATELWSCRKTF